METCCLEVIILDLDTRYRGSSPSLAVICDFFVVISVCFVFLLSLFGVLKRPALFLSVHMYVII